MISAHPDHSSHRQLASIFARPHFDKKSLRSDLSLAELLCSPKQCEVMGKEELTHALSSAGACLECWLKKRQTCDLPAF